MIIPTRYIWYGDIDAAKALQGTGKKYLNQLNTDLSFQNVKTGRSEKRFADGTVITSVVNHNLSEVHIFVPVKDQGPAQDDRMCLCNCGFSVGQIVRVTGEHIGEARLYDVAICNNETKYILYQDILASDFSEYHEGQVVILIPYNDNIYSCCSQSIKPTGCAPIKTLNVKASDYWRTTYRIIPWCGSSLPKWRYK